LKLNRRNYAYIASNTLTTRAIIKWTSTPIHSGNIVLTRSGMPRNIKSFVKTETNQSAQL